MARRAVRNAFVLLKPTLDQKAFDKAAADAGKRAGNTAARELEQEMKKHADGTMAPLEEETKESISEGAKKGSEEGGSQAGKILVAAITSAVSAMSVGPALKGAIERDDSFAKMRVEMGASAAEAEKYGEIAGQLYMDAFGESINNVNDAIAVTMRNAQGLSSDVFDESQLESYAGTILNLERTFGESASAISRAATQMVRTGIADNFEHALDLLTKGLQSPANGAEDLLDTFNEYSVNFARMGISGEEALGIINQGLLGGARNSDIVADAFKEVTNLITDGGDEIQGALAGIGLSWRETTEALVSGGDGARSMIETIVSRINAIEDPVARAQAQMQIFGSQGEDLAQSFAAFDFSSAAESIGDVSNATEEMNEVLGETTAARLASLRRGFEVLFSEQIMEMALPALEGLLGLLQDNLGVVVPFATVIGGLAGGILAVNAALSAWQAAQVVWIGVTKIATAVQWAFNAAMSANPIVRIIMLVTTLVGALIWFFTQTEAGKKIWESIVAALGAAVKWIGDTLVPAIGKFFTAIGNFFVGIWEWIKGIWEKITGFFSGIGKFFGGIFGGGTVNLNANAYGMASGGTVAPQPGGTLVRLAEAGRPETVVDTGNTNELISRILDGSLATRNETKVEVNVYQQPGEDGEAFAERVARVMRRKGVYA